MVKKSNSKKTVKNKNKSVKKNIGKIRKTVDRWCKKQSNKIPHPRYKKDTYGNCSVALKICSCNDNDGSYTNIKKQFIKRFGKKSINAKGEILYNSVEL
jgi:hypothetical protein